MKKKGCLYWLLIGWWIKLLYWICVGWWWNNPLIKGLLLFSLGLTAFIALFALGTGCAIVGLIIAAIVFVVTFIVKVLKSTISNSNGILNEPITAQETIETTPLMNEKVVFKTETSDKIVTDSAKSPNDELARYVQTKLNRAEFLSHIVNTTTDEHDFYLYLNEINRILYDLKQYEDRISFSKPPSEMLKAIAENRNKSIENLQTRIRLKNFDVESYARECNDLLDREDRQQFDYDSMEGHDFESFCSSLLCKNHFENVSVTSGSNDQGIDIIAFKDGVKYGIQCKCYSSDVGNKAVQEAYSGAKFYDCHVPVVLTNRYFTKSAIELSKKTNVLLWDRDYLEELIDSTTKHSQ
jgi:hypothetical protein